MQHIHCILNHSGVTGGGAGAERPPETSDREISADLSGKKRQGKNGKGENGEEKKENCNREGGKSLKMRRRLLFFFFSLFKMTKICFGCTKMEIFYREKGIHAGKKIRKNDFAPSEKNLVTPLLNQKVIIQIQIPLTGYVD